MARTTGTFNFAANYEVRTVQPLDARQLVDTYADLTNPATWNQSGREWLFNGAMVAVGSDPDPNKNSVYLLKDVDNYTDEASWVKLESSEVVASGITKASNGLTKQGKYVVLGGPLTGDTNISGLDTNNLTLSGGSLQYGGDYSGTYTQLSIPDVGYVTGLTSSIGLQKVLDTNNTASGTLMSVSNSNSLGGGTFEAASINLNNGYFEMAGCYNDGTATCFSCVSTYGTNACFSYEDGSNAANNASAKFSTSGFTYDNDYSGNASARWIPDAAWVTGQTGAIQATNGLTREGDNIVLGGALTGDTTISGSSYSVNFGNPTSSGVTINRFQVVPLNDFFVWGGLNTSTGFPAYNIQGSETDLFFTFKDNSSFGNEKGLCLDLSESLFRDDINQQGIIYDDDYSANFVARSLPDAEYVTGITSNLTTCSDFNSYTGDTDIRLDDIENDIVNLSGSTITGATNGLNVSGQDIKLGGTLTEDTTISYPDYGSFEIDVNNPTQSGCAYLELSNVDPGFGGIGVIYACTEDHSWSMQDQNAFQIRDCRSAGNTTGVEYFDDYSSGFVARSLPDVAYVTGITNNIQNDISQTITGATNGLTKVGQEVTLGGVLTGNTEISGLGVYDLEFTGGWLKYSANYSGSVGPLTIPDAAWVTGQTGAIQANNGLTREGDNITLGGSLTGDTEISGTNTLAITTPNYAEKIQYHDFDTSPSELPTVPLNEGLMFFSGHSLNLQREFTNVRTQLGEESVIRVANESGALIENGSFVYFSGAVAGVPTVEKSIANDFMSATRAFGMVTHDISDGEEGYVTTLGAVRGLDTSSYSAGDLLWLSDTTAGQWSTTRPSYPNYSVAVGEVTRSDATNGIIYVRPLYVPNYTEFGEFTGYTASTETTLNNKLDESIFDTYTGDTETTLNDIQDVTNVAITGETGGLTKVGDHDLRLGGEIEQNTTINGSHRLTLSPSDQLILRTTGNNDLNIDAQGNGSAIFKAQQGTITTPDDFTNSVGILADYDQTSGFVIYDNRSGGSQEGIRYDDDYSSNFTDRSLVDKAYVDAVATGLQAKAATDVATTGDITLSGLTTVDGISLQTGDRVLVKDQTDASENGIYSASTGNWGRTDDYDFSPSGEISNGDLIPVLTGDTNQSSQWILTTDDPISSGQSLNFSLFSQLLDISAGNGIDINTAGNTKQISVDLASNSGLAFTAGDLRIASTFAGSGLTLNSGVLNICAADTAISGSEVDVKFGLNNELVVDSDDFQTLTANNGITIDGNDNITLGGNLTGDTAINGNTNAYDFTICDVNSFNVSFNNTSTITDDRGVGSAGLEYAANYGSEFTCRSLVDAEFVNDQITGDTLTFNNGLTKQGDIISWGGTLTGDTQIQHGAGRICMIDGGISCVDLKSDCSRVHVENTSMYIRSCQLGSCSGTVSIDNTGQIGLTTNNASTGITVTDNGAGVGVVYAADYSSTFVDRSLVDKEYVDTCVSTSTGAIDGSNGLSRSGDNIILGGSVLSSGTIISGGSQTLNIGTTSSLTNFTGLYSFNTCAGFKSDSSDCVGTLEATAAKVALYSADANSDSELIVSRDDGIAINLSGTSNVMYYGGDYSSLYNARSIPDVNYVTGLTNANRPAGEDTYIQFNSGDTFSAFSGFTYDPIQNSFTSGYRCGSVGLNSIVLGGFYTTGGMGAYDPNEASGYNAIAMGRGAIANAFYTTAIGNGVVASSNGAFALGSNTVASNIAAMAAGNSSIASGDTSMSFGDNSVAGGDHSFAFGENTIASGDNSVAGGLYSCSTGEHSYAFGVNVCALNVSSIGFGRDSKIYGDRSVSIGDSIIINGTYSYGFGRELNVSDDCEIVIGAFNVSGTTGENLFTIGNGISAGDRSNAFQILKNGNTTINGNLTLEDVTVSGTTGGLKYDVDYSANFTARSLPDVEYVTGYTNSAITTSFNNTITGATNGLTKVGQEVELGGPLDGNTLIDGGYDLNLNLSSFNVTGASTFNTTVTINSILQVSSDVDLSSKLNVTGSTILGDTVQIDGALTLNSVTTGSNTDDVLTITSSGEVQKISSDELGEDNNRYSVTGVSNSTVNLNGTEYVVLVDTTSGAVTVNLPTSPDNGTAVKIKDTGNALNNNITITNGTIDGDTTALINTNYGALELVYDGTSGEWYSLAFIN